MQEEWTVTQYHAYLRGEYAQHLIRQADAYAPPVQALQAPGISHTAFRTAIWRLAKQYGWKMYYTKNARKSPLGFPDIILARAYEPVIYAELKIPPDTLTIEQEQWLAVLALARNTETYLWRPEDWPQIDARLTQPQRSSP